MLATVWGDDGAETDYLMAIDGLTLFSEACWQGETFSLAECEEMAECLTGLPAAQYAEFLAKLAARASVTGDEEIVLNARDRAAVGEAVVKAANEKLGGGKLRLSERVGSFAGGLILSRGNVEANCTAELLVELCRGEMSAEIADMLFA